MRDGTFCSSYCNAGRRGAPFLRVVTGTRERNMSKQLDQASSPDEAIIEAVRSGNVDAFEELVEKYEGRVFMIVRAHVPSSAADDVAQDVFVRAYRALASFAGKSPFEHWLAGIATRTCFDYWRKQYRIPEYPASSVTPEQKEWMEQILATESRRRYDELTKREEAVELLQTAMRSLTAAERSVLTLVHIEGHSVREAANRLGFSVVNIKVRLYRARRKLRQAMENLLVSKVIPS